MKSHFSTTLRPQNGVSFIFHTVGDSIVKVWVPTVDKAIVEMTKSFLEDGGAVAGWASLCIQFSVLPLLTAYLCGFKVCSFGLVCSFVVWTLCSFGKCCGKFKNLGSDGERGV